MMFNHLKTMSNTHSAYLETLISTLLERAREAKLDAESATTNNGSADFQQGRSIAYYEVLDTARNLAIAFQLSDSELIPLNLEKELLRSVPPKDDKSR